MSPSDLVAMCAPADIDASGVCTSLHWVQQNVFGFPPLTAAEGTLISGSIGAVWAIGFLVRTLRSTAR